MAIGLSNENLCKWKLRFLPSEIKPKRILDIGSGLQAVYRDELTRLGKYISVDIRKGPGVDIVADIQNLPFPNKYFGLVWASEIFEHLEVEEQKRALRETIRVGWKMVITYPGLHSPNFLKDPGHRPVMIKWGEIPGAAYREFSNGEVVVAICCDILP
jgi:hypothetical protein